VANLEAAHRVVLRRQATAGTLYLCQAFKKQGGIQIISSGGRFNLLTRLSLFATDFNKF